MTSLPVFKASRVCRAGVHEEAWWEKRGSGGVQSTDVSHRVRKTRSDQSQSLGKDAPRVSSR